MRLFFSAFLFIRFVHINKAFADISAIASDNVSFSVSSETNSVLDVRFNTDGSSMYVLGGDNDTIFQYTLATPWDVSTAEYDTLSFL